MITPDPVLIREIPVIQKIVADETWLEGERRGCYVHSDDCVVREKVCEVILRIGQQLRESVSGSSHTLAMQGSSDVPSSVTNTGPSC